MTPTPPGHDAADHAGPEVVVAGHICLDVIPRLHAAPALEPGHLTIVGPAVISTGGAVANTGLALHRLGTSVSLMGKVGDDAFGRAVLELLSQHDPRLIEGMIVDPSETTSYTIVINPPGADRSFLHCPAANDTFSAADVRYEQLHATRIFHFGYPPLMRLMYEDGGDQLRGMFARVREAGPATSLDLSEPDPDSSAGRVDWEQLLTRALPFVDVFHPSIDELLFMFDRPAYERRHRQSSVAGVIDTRRLAELGELLLDMGTAVVAIKLGDAGLYLRTTRDESRLREFCDRAGITRAERWLTREVLVPCFAPSTVTGTTGAGDCTIAGFLAALLRDEDPEVAATSATAVGACSVESLDATSGIPPWPEIAARIHAGWPRAPSPLS